MQPVISHSGEFDKCRTISDLLQSQRNYKANLLRVQNETLNASNPFSLNSCLLLLLVILVFFRFLSRVYWFAFNFRRAILLLVSFDHRTAEFYGL